MIATAMQAISGISFYYDATTMFACIKFLKYKKVDVGLIIRAINMPMVGRGSLPIK